VPPSTREAAPGTRHWFALERRNIFLIDWTEAVGWASVFFLFATMAGQAWKQWSERVTKGIGKWFFAGQICASVGFLTYSILTGSRVFIVGNALVLLAAITGGLTLWWNRTHRQSAGTAAKASSHPASHDAPLPVASKR
jgi:MtN3 and saliva related transmembrane protein